MHKRPTCLPTVCTYGSHTSTSFSPSSILGRPHTTCWKYLQLTNDKLVQAELALRFWREHQNLYLWAPIPLFTCRPVYRCLELALIQEWQPRLNYPFICQFFHPKKGLLKRPAMNTNAQFGLATLYGEVLAIDSHPRLSRTFWPLTDFNIGYSCGISFTTWDPTPKHGAKQQSIFDRTKGALHFAMSYVDLPLVFKSYIAPSLCRPSTPPLSGGKGNLPSSLWASRSVGSQSGLGDFPSAVSSTMASSHAGTPRTPAMSHRSKPYSSNMLHSWASSATTNPLCRVLVYGHHPDLLLPTLAKIQKCNTES